MEVDSDVGSEVETDAGTDVETDAETEESAEVDAEDGAKVHAEEEVDVEVKAPAAVLNAKGPRSNGTKSFPPPRKSSIGAPPTSTHACASN